MAMTFAQLVDRAEEYLEDTGNARWSAVLIGAFVNDAQRDFCRGSNIVRKQSSALAVAATTPTNAFYTLPLDFFELESVWSNGEQLFPATTSDLGWNYATTTGTPTRYLFGEFGATELRVWPYPSSVLTSLTVFYTALPADLTGSNVSVIPPAYHIALAYYAVAQCYLRDNQYKDPAKGQMFMSMYERELADATSRSARAFSSDSMPIRPRYL